MKCSLCKCREPYHFHINVLFIDTYLLISNLIICSTSYLYGRCDEDMRLYVYAYIFQYYSVKCSSANINLISKYYVCMCACACMFWDTYIAALAQKINI